MTRGIVAIVGRPNVGKSTLFNTLVGKRQALVDDQPGVTRDRHYGIVKSGEQQSSYLVIDTGGFETDDFNTQPFSENLIWSQTKAAIEESDLVVMMFDGRAGLQPHDEELVRLLQKLGKKTIYTVNKLDSGEQQRDLLSDFYQLGLDDFHILSAAHRYGVGELREKISHYLSSIETTTKKDVDEEAVKIALIGRPNAGKSSILNRLLGREQALVSEVAGTTRDAIDTPLTYNGQSMLIVDTAGIRRRTRIKEKLEGLSIFKSFASIERADVVVLVLDASQGLTDQDARLASLAISQFKPLLIVVNKWDLIANKNSNSAKEYAEELRYRMKSLQYAPAVFVSCLENQRVQKILPLAMDLFEQSKRRIPTARLNELLEKVVFEHTPALMRNLSKRVKFYYATQVSVRPPTVVIKCNVADQIQESYKRYMMNRFRKELGLTNVPIRLLFRGKDHKRKEDEVFAELTQ